IEKKALDIATNCANKLGFSIISVEYVFENGIKILRVIGNGPNGFSIDDATALNEEISAELDKEDFIDEEYYLEVSSEGIEKELRNDNDIKNAVGGYIYAKFYEKIDNIKEVYGDLESFDGENLEIKYNVKGRIKHLTVKKEQICIIRMAIKF
ncbi:MAG: ribosome maturation factor RimP, partial [Bacilli bacterium]|nr:ribosome maturation factor RimP [Bacilli bacterium]